MGQLRQVKMARRNLIRVFLSSTFRDMTKEREHLNKVIFPEIRRAYHERGVEFSAIDLRWGITEDEVNKGDVITICLEEIDRCKPFFLGFLGERYGWAPAKGDVRYYERLIERFPVTETSLVEGLSVTEMEILHGVLESEGRVKASFYQRDAELTEELARGEAREIYFEEDEAALEKLNRLKRRIRDSDYPTHSYGSVEAMGEQVKADLLNLLDELHPESEPLDPLEAERRRHRAYAEDRVSSYLANEGSVQTLHDFINRERDLTVAQQPLLVAGPSGRGKSALVSYWLTDLMEREPERWLIEHYAGVAGDDNATATLTRIINEIRRALAPEEMEQLPSDFDDLGEAFRSWLDKVPRDKPLLLVIDAIDQISAPNLSWIPTVVPPNVTCVMSALPSEQADWLTERDAESFEVPSLDVDARREVTEGYLARYRKKLSPDQLERVVQAEPCESPLFLTTVLAELVIFGSYERLDDYIDYLVNSEGLGELFERMISRFEEDYGLELTRGVLEVLWASKTGLSDHELVGITHFPLVEVSKITLALGQHLKENAEQIQFSHQFLRDAIKRRYIADSSRSIPLHTRLAAWFEANGDRPRKTRMICEQYSLAEDWASLHSKWTCPKLGVEALNDLPSHQLHRGWSSLERSLNVNLTSEYKKLCQSGERFWDGSLVREWLYGLLNYRGTDVKFRAECCEHVITYYKDFVSRHGVDRFDYILRKLCHYINELGQTYIHIGQLDDAYRVLREAEELLLPYASDHAEDESASAMLCQTLNSLASVERYLLSPEEALETFQRSYAISSEQRIKHSSDLSAQCHHYALVSLEWIGDIERYRNNNQEALECYRAHLEISKAKYERYGDLYSKLGYSVSLERLGVALMNLGRFGEASENMNKSLELRLEFHRFHDTISSLDGVALAYEKCGDIALRLGDYRGALEYYRVGLTYQRKLAKMVDIPDYQTGLAITLVRAAKVFRVMGDYQQSIDYTRESIELMRELISEKTDVFAEVILLYSMVHCAWAYNESKQYGESLTLARQILPLYESRQSHYMMNDDLRDLYLVTGVALLSSTLPTERALASDHIEEALRCSESVLRDDPSEYTARLHAQIIELSNE